MTFAEIPIRMLQLGVDRQWLCKECDYSSSTLAGLLAPKGSNKNDKALRRIWEALDREDARQKTPVAAFERQQLVLRPNEHEYRIWSAAQRKSGASTLADWAVTSLNALTHTIHQSETAVYQQPGRNFDSWAKTGLDEIAAEELGKIKPAAGNALQSLPPARVPKRKNGA